MQKVYTYNKTGNSITSISKTQVGADTIDYSISYTGNLVQAVSDNVLSDTKTIVTFDRDINDEVTRMVLHDKKKFAIVKTAESDKYNEFYKRKVVLSKKTEYNGVEDYTLNYTSDNRIMVKAVPISILRNIGLDWIGVSQEIPMLQSIRTPDDGYIITPKYYDNKLVQVQAEDRFKNLNYNVNLVYEGDTLIRLEEYSLKLDPAGKMNYLVDAVFTFKYNDDRLQYILCTGTPYKRIDLQYNAVGDLVAVHKITTAKTLWYSFYENYIEFNDNKIITWFMNKDSNVSEITDNDIVLKFKNNTLKTEVNNFVIPGLITPTKKYYDAMMYNIDLLGSQTYIENIDFNYKGFYFFSLKPEYKRGKIYNINITVNDTKVGFVRYFYNKNLVSAINTYYYGKDGTTPIWVSSFDYDRNPYDPSDRSLKVEFDYASTDEYKLGKYSFKMTSDYQVFTLLDNHSKRKVADVEFNDFNKPISYTKHTPDLHVLESTYETLLLSDLIKYNEE